MSNVDRRTILATGALALAGAAAEGSAAHAQAGPKSIFPVGTTTIPIVGETDVFPVRRIYCIGRNYAAHAREMGSDPNREPPFFFQKPTDAIQNVADRRGRRSSLSLAHQELSLRGRTGGGAEIGRHQYSGGARRSTTSTAMRSAST